MPMMMDGTPASTSAPNRTDDASRPGLSWRKSATNRPRGIAMSKAMPTISAEPMIAVEIPPPGTP